MDMEIPFDIWIEIVVYLRSADLASLARSSRTLFEIVQPFLYETVHFSRHQAGRYSLFDEPLHILPTLELLAAESGLGRRVRELNFHVPLSTMMCKALVNALPHLVSLESLDLMRSTPTEAYLDALEQVVDALRNRKNPLSELRFCMPCGRIIKGLAGLSRLCILGRNGSEQAVVEFIAASQSTLRYLDFDLELSATQGTYGFWRLRFPHLQELWFFSWRPELFHPPPIVTAFCRAHAHITECYDFVYGSVTEPRGPRLHLRISFTVERGYLMLQSVAAKVDALRTLVGQYRDRMAPTLRIIKVIGMKTAQDLVHFRKVCYELDNTPKLEVLKLGDELTRQRSYAKGGEDSFPFSRQDIIVVLQSCIGLCGPSTRLREFSLLIPLIPLDMVEFRTIVLMIAYLAPNLEILTIGEEIIEEGRATIDYLQMLSEELHSLREILLVSPHGRHNGRTLRCYVPRGRDRCWRANAVASASSSLLSSPLF